MPSKQDYGVLEQRIYGVEKAQTVLGERVEALASGLDARIDRLTMAQERNHAALLDKLERRSAPAWQAFSVIAFVSIFIIGSFGGLSMLLIQSQIGAAQDRTIENRQLINQRLPIEEFKVWIDGINRRAEGQAQALMQLRTEAVSHPEHQALSERVTRTEGALGSITPVGDVLKDIQQRLQRLEERPWRMREDRPGTLN